MGLRSCIWKLNDTINSSGNMNGTLMLDLDLLRSFVSVVDTGGFTRAGERVHRTQSTVSQQIKRLEESLGHTLLHRNGKQTTLTEQGERLVSYARRLLALEQEARDVVARRTAKASCGSAPGGFRRLSTNRAVVGFCPLAPGSEARRALRSQRASAPRD